MFLNPLKELQKQSEPIKVNTHVFKFVFVLDVLSNELGVLYGLLHRYGLFEGGTDIATGADGCHTPRAEEVVIGARERQRQGRLAETRHHATAIIPADEDVQNLSKLKTIDGSITSIRITLFSSLDYMGNIKTKHRIVIEKSIASFYDYTTN